jgi:tetratricopeptide (TPR) repeat protein
VEALAHRARGAFMGMLGEFGQARALLEHDRAMMENLGLPIALAVGTEVWGMVELLAGEPGAAEAKLREGLAILTPIGETSGRFELEALLAEALCAQERYDEVLALTEETMTSAPREDVSVQVRWRGPRAKALARRGQRRQAEQLAREGVRLAETTDFLNLCGNALVDLADVLRLARRREESASALRQAVKLFAKKGNVVAAARTRTQLRATSAVASVRPVRKRAIS